MDVINSETTKKKSFSCKTLRNGTVLPTFRSNAAGDAILTVLTSRCDQQRNCQQCGSNSLRLRAGSSDRGCSAPCGSLTPQLG